MIKGNYSVSKKSSNNIPVASEISEQVMSNIRDTLRTELGDPITSEKIETLQAMIKAKRVEAEKLIQSASFSITDIRNLDQEYNFSKKDLMGDSNPNSEALAD